MFGLCLIEASDKYAGLAASKHTPDSVCSREKRAGNGQLAKTLVICKSLSRNRCTIPINITSKRH